MLDFRGLGLLTALGRVLLGGVFGSLSAVHRWDAVVAGFFTSIIIYFIIGPGKVLLERATGSIVSFSTARSLSFRTYLYWAPLIVGFAICCLITK